MTLEQQVQASKYFDANAARQLTTKRVASSNQNKFNLQASKMVLEPLSTSAGQPHQYTIPSGSTGAQTSTKRQQKSGLGNRPKFDEGHDVLANGPPTLQQKESSNMMLQLNSPQLAQNLNTNGVVKASTNSRLSNRAVAPKPQPTFPQRRDFAASEKTDQHRRASHQPSSVMQNRISSQMAYRCFSRQKQQSKGQSRESHSVVGSRQQRSDLGSKGGGIAAGQGDIGPLPRACMKQQAHNSSLIVVQSSSEQQELQAYPLQETSRQASVENPFETERQLIIARGGSLTRKTNMDDEEDIFNDRGGFRIKINKEQKVVNHLEDRVENNNLLFYNFNAYKQDNCDGKVRDYSGIVFNRHDESASNYEAAAQVANQQINRPYSRGSTHSRQDYRQRQIQSAASVNSVMSRKQRHGGKKSSIGNPSRDQQRPKLKHDEVSVDSRSSLETQPNMAGPAMMLSSELRDSSEKYQNPNSNQRSGHSQNRYKQQVMAKSAKRQYETSAPQTALGQQTLVANGASSASLTTAATTKGSDFGNHGVKQSSSSGKNNNSQNGGSNTPQRDASQTLNEMDVPPRPTNSSRVFYEQSQSGTTRKARGSRASGAAAPTGSEQPENKVLIPSQYLIIKASQTSIGANSFARSAMRLKQKSSRNGIPNRGGSLDGCQSTTQQKVADEEIISRAGRTAGGAVWSRMLNMQSVEEGIQEGNVSDEDD